MVNKYSMIWDWKRRYYYPLNILPMIDCIVGFVLNYEELVGLYYRWSTCNIPYSNASEYSNTNTSNFSVSKYYVTQKKNMELLPLI